MFYLRTKNGNAFKETLTMEQFEIKCKGRWKKADVPIIEGTKWVEYIYIYIYIDEYSVHLVTHVKPNNL